MQYLFNAPEGFARLVLEHKVRPSQHLRAAFLMQIQPHAAVNTLLCITMKIFELHSTFVSFKALPKIHAGIHYTAYLYPDAIILPTDFRAIQGLCGSLLLCHPYLQATPKLLTRVTGRLSRAHNETSPGWT